MRKFPIALMALLFVVPLTLFSQNTLTVHFKDGRSVSFGFEEKPVVSFTDNTLLVKSTNVDVEYQLITVAKFTFDTLETSVDEVRDDSRKASISLDAYTVYVTGAKAEDQVRVVATDGKVLKSYKTDDQGSASFSIEDLPEGIYIVNIEELSIKFIKK